MEFGCYDMSAVCYGGTATERLHHMTYNHQGTAPYGAAHRMTTTGLAATPAPPGCWPNTGATYRDMDDSCNAATASPYFPMGTPSQPNGDRSRESPSSSDAMNAQGQQQRDGGGTLPFKVKEEPPDWTTMPPNNGCSMSSSDLDPSSSNGSVHIKQEPPDTHSTQNSCIPPAPAPAAANVKKEPGTKVKQEKVTDSMPQKKKRDRFNGMSEEEVLKRTLPDHLHEGLDIVIIGINPGLTAAYVGHHYAGPGNHFWKCIYLSGLIPEPMNAYDDYKLREFGIGFTNIVERTSRGQADLTRKEIKEGGEILRAKIQQFKPKIAVFNGKGIYEIFCGHKNFYIGKQPEPFPGTDTAVFVMPSSSARCSQLPRAVDKVPFYIALKKLRDYLRGDLASLDDSEVVFPDLELKVEPRKDRAEGQVKQEPKPKKDRKRKKQDDSGNPYLNGGVMPPPGAMGPWGGPGMVPPHSSSQVPTMDSIFGGTPSLVKTEDSRELSQLSNCGLFPPGSQVDGAPYYGPSFPGNWMPPSTGGGGFFPGQSGSAFTSNINGDHGCQQSPSSSSSFGQPGQNSFPGMSFPNGSSFEAGSPNSAFMNPAGPLSPGQLPPSAYSQGSPSFPPYPVNGPPGFGGNSFPQPPGS